ncbi:MAG: DUF309 domain-containing protein [Pseudomonadota bacterium]
MTGSDQSLRLPDLPTHAHRPGQGTAPDMAPLHAAKALLPDAEAIDWAALNQLVPFDYGLRLYEARYFWEAHEVWEPVWLAASPNSAPRCFLAGVIQLANAALKLSLVQPKAARRLIALSCQHVDEARARGACGPRYDAQTLEALAAAARGWSTLIEAQERASDGPLGEAAAVALVDARPRLLV